MRGTGLQEIYFRVGRRENIRLKIVPICCDGCLGTPFEFVVEAIQPTTTLPPSTTVAPTTIPPTTTIPPSTVPPRNTYSLCFSAAKGNGNFPVLQVQAFNGTPSVNIGINEIYADGLQIGDCSSPVGQIRTNVPTTYFAFQNGKLTIPNNFMSGSWGVVNRVTVYNVIINGIGAVSDGQVISIGNDDITISLADCTVQDTMPCNPETVTDLTGYYATFEDMQFVSYPTDTVRMTFRRPYTAIQNVRVFYSYRVNDVLREGSFEWNDGNTLFILMIPNGNQIFTPSNLTVPTVTYVETI